MNAKQRTRPQNLCMGIVLLGLCAAVQAHQVWLEQPESGNAVLRFGEFGENLRETSPGLLDNFGAPSAKLFTKGKAREITPVKAAMGFTLPVRAARGESLTAEDSLFPIRVSARREGPEGREGRGEGSREGREGAREAREGGREGRGEGAREGREAAREFRSLFWPAARFVTDFSAQTPGLTLDIVPTGKAGAFKVTFKDKPLPKADVQIVVQSGWRKRGRTDAEGVVTFDLPWKGQYVLEVSHVERTPGERNGEKYDSINYATTLTFVQPTGAAPAPAGPAAKPNPGK
ncbi:MAG: DUF4198 domain-containing protein [Azoarcus sp.]|jgi:uncharacterized GH25 family protein|nr:DUF4198 domain-containing protein [Azoarcus sp.]